MTATPDEENTREIRAPGPSPDPEALRLAYLGLLKLCLCDLSATQTLTVSRIGAGNEPGQILFTRELRDEELWVRAQGLDWPWGGLTMVGLARLDDLQFCVEQVVAEGVAGDLIEAGVWRGGASILMRATLDTLGATDRTVWLADSFEGLPEPDEAFPEDRNLDLSWIGYLAASVQDVRTNFERFGCESGVSFVEGYFEETLPSLRDRRWSIVRVDADTYESTWTALTALYPGLTVGGFLIVDDYQFVNECRAAVDDFRREHRIEEPVEKIDRVGVRWRRVSDAPIRPAKRLGIQRRAGRQGSARSRNVQYEGHIPSLEEVHLTQEMKELRNQIAAAEAQAERRLGNRVRAKLRRAKDE